METFKDLVLINNDGSVEAGVKEAREKLSRLAGQYRLMDTTPGLVILRKLYIGGDTSDARVLMAGEIAFKTTLLEVINMVAHTGWHGDLHVYGPDAHRVLRFDQASLKSATSDLSEERLGEIMISQGLISEQQLQEALVEQNEQRRIGQILVDKNYIEPEKLFSSLKRQMEQIFFACLIIPSGNYVFVHPDKDAEAHYMTMHLPIQGLLMEGVQRIDEMSLFRERIPNGNLCPVVVRGVTPGELKTSSLAVYSLINGHRSILDISKEVGWDEFQTTKIIYHLLQNKLIELHLSQHIDQDTIRHLVEQFNLVLQLIFKTVDKYEGIQQMSETLTTWIMVSGYDDYFGEDICERRGIDEATVIQALDESSLERPLEALYHSLHDISSFALFAATSTLPRNVERALSKHVNEQLDAIRL